MVEVTQPLAGTETLSPRRSIRRSWSAPAVVIAMALGLILVIFAVFGFLCWQAFGTTVETAKGKARTAATIVAEDTSWALGGELVSLGFIANLGAAALDPASRPQIDAALKHLPTEAHLGLYDANGAAVGTVSAAGLPQNVADAGYFAELKQGRDWVIPPLDAPPSEILVARRLGTDAFAGIAVLALPMTLLQSFWEPQHLGVDSTVVLNREDGWMVGRYPPLPRPLNVAKTAVNWPMITANQTGTYTTLSPIDGVTRVVAFEHLPSLGLIVFATISQDAAFASIWNSIIIVLWLIGPIALMLLAFALVIARILRQSERTQAKLAAAVAHNEVLFREIHHRVKNNLQSVGSLLQMQPIAKEIKTDMGQRIAAMSAVHEHIYRSNNFSTVQVKDYLTTLIENIRAGADPKVRVVEQLEDLAVDKDAATPLGLILNEVVANAFKHAFPDGREGVISVTLTADPDGRGRLNVADNGVGFDPAKPAKGIGQRLIKALTAQLGGESEMTSGDGSQFTLWFPLAK